MSTDSHWYFLDGKHGKAGQFRSLSKAQAAEDEGRCELARGQPLRKVGSAPPASEVDEDTREPEKDAREPERGTDEGPPAGDPATD